MSQRLLVYGGTGAFGSSCVSFFKKHGYWICSVGTAKSLDADCNVVIENMSDLEEQQKEVLSAVKDLLNGSMVDGVICAAGGWCGGNCNSENFIRGVDASIKQSLWSSTVAASICSKYLRPGGLFVLFGSMAALDPTPKMIGYGLAKAAVHHLTTSLAKPKSGMPHDSTVVALLPTTLDTPANREAMPKADRSKWVPLEFINELLLGWLQNKERPKSGSLVKLVADGKVECLVSQ